MSNPRAYTIADLHLCHEKILDYGREFESIVTMHNTIWDNWTGTVHEQDTVYVLGDVAICNGDPRKKWFALEFIRGLPGRKVLVAGNHDKSWIYPAFDDVVGYVERKRVILSHMPVHPNQKDRFRMNIHGHLHENGVTERVLNDWEQHYIDKPDPWYVCVSCEQVDYTPVAFSEIVSQRR
jgi:calcineurin-like phosphoesterase family protein